nr:MULTISPECIES: TetR/AcrR family transcriptional regulator [unclassified Rhodococcus (in: high G+C Gram-positive bacteria)]
MYDAVLEVYWERGWSGFTLDAVARKATVGRAALYRRWASKGDLLVDALEARSPLAEPIDLGTFRADLVELAVQLLVGYRSTAGLVSLRVALDARVHPDLLGHMMDTLNRSRLVAARSIVHRAQERGEAPKSTDTTRILDLVTGAVLSHVIFSHRQVADQTAENDRVYAESMVDTVLSA